LPNYIEGVQDTDLVLDDERKADVPTELEWLRPDNAPLIKLTRGREGYGLPIKKELTTDPEFKVLEKEERACFTAINDGAGYTAGDTALTVDSCDHINPDDMLQVLGGEIVRVTAKNNSTKVVTVVRACGQTTADAIADNTPLYTIGSAHEEYSALPTILMLKNRKRVNYTQIFRLPFGVSRTLKHTRLHTGKKVPELRREAFLEFEKRIERAFLWQEPKEDATGGPNGKVIRYTGGVNYWIVTGGGNVTTVTETFTKTGWLTYVRNCFEYGSDTKVFLCAPLLIEMLDYWKDGKLEMKPSDELYGIRVAEWETGHGRLLIVRDRDLKNSPAGSGAGHGGTGFTLDPENLGLRYLEESDMALFEDVVKDGHDGSVDCYLAEVGLELALPETHSKLTGVVTYS